MALAPKSKQDATLTSASNLEKSKSKIYYSKARTETLDDNSFFLEIDRRDDNSTTHVTKGRFHPEKIVE
jgi:hypothetical protein